MGGRLEVMLRDQEMEEPPGRGLLGHRLDSRGEVKAIATLNLSYIAWADITSDPVQPEQS